MSTDLTALNESVAQKLGWYKKHDKWWAYFYNSDRDGGHLELPSYVTDVKEAWDLVEKMGGQNKVHLGYELYLRPRCRCTVFADGGGGTYEKLANFEEETITLAICKAFLKVPLATSPTVKL